MGNKMENISQDTLTKIIRKNLIDILMVQQWQKIKGELFALLELSGSNFTEYSGNQRIPMKWEPLRDVINDFIEKIESEELQISGTIE